MEKSGIQLLKEFFEADNGRKLTMEEMKTLSAEARQELADLVANALGYTKKDVAGKVVYVK